MILSIVRSSQYIRGSKPQLLQESFTQGNIEWVGPVVGPNIASMRNFGAEKASGEWILFVDEDCEINTDKVLKIIEQIENGHSSWGAFAGVYKQKTKSKIQQTYNRIQRLWVLKGLQEKQGLRHKGNHLLGGCLVVKKEAWEKAHGFCEKIGWGGEEFDFILRLQRVGYETGVSYSFRVNHESKIGIFGFIKRAWKQNYNRGFYKIAPITHEKNNIFSFKLALTHSMFISLFWSVAQVGFILGLLNSRLTHLFRA